MQRHPATQRFARPGAILGCLGTIFCALLLATIGMGEEPGQTPRPKDVEPPKEVPEEELVKLDKKFEHFAFVESNAPLASVNRGVRTSDVKSMQAAEHEQKAYDYVLHFALRQPNERLQQYSIKNVPVENLLRPIHQDYLRELIHVEGKLALVTEMKPTDSLKDLSGIEQLYEVWVYAKGSNKLVCVVVSELPEGVKPGEDFDIMASFDAYFFKLWHYESRQQKEGSKDVDKKQWQRAPLFLGKSFQVSAPIEVQSIYSPVMLMSVVGGLCALGLAAFLISLWFRKGDQEVKATALRKIGDQANFDNVLESPVNRYPDFS